MEEPAMSIGPISVAVPASFPALRGSRLLRLPGASSPGRNRGMPPAVPKAATR
jgi:hypothetical protein